jgi:putative transposase
LLDKFSFQAKRKGGARDYKVWTDDNHAIDLDSRNIDMMEKINCSHNNPVVAGIVRNPEDYIYNSAFDYSRRGKGLVNVIVL